VKSYIDIIQVSKKYKNADQESLKNLSVQIPIHSKFGILGPNGAGKTTLISILCGIIEPTHGRVDYFINNEKITPFLLKYKIGYVPQEYAFYEELTPLQNLSYFGAFYNLSKQEIKTKSDVLLSVLGLESVTNKRIKTFSGGMKRRVNLAIGLIHDPEILFLDEPTVGVDAQSKFAIIKFLENLNKSGTTIIYTSHHLSEAENFCSHIALIDKGKLVANNLLGDLIEQNQAANLEDLFIKLTGEDYRDV